VHRRGDDALVAVEIGLFEGRLQAAKGAERAMRSRFCASMVLGAPAEVWAAHGLRHPLGDGHRGFLDLVSSRVTAAHVDQAAATMTPELLLTLMYAGRPTDVCDEVAPLAAAVCTHFIIANVGASFTGEGVKGLWRLAALTRNLRRLASVESALPAAACRCVAMRADPRY